MTPEGRVLLAEEGEMFGAEQALVCRTDHFESSLEILSNALDSSSWYRHWGVRLIVWPGDLVITGDLVDDDFSPYPALVMCGGPGAAPLAARRDDLVRWRAGAGPGPRGRPLQRFGAVRRWRPGGHRWAGHPRRPEPARPG